MRLTYKQYLAQVKEGDVGEPRFPTLHIVSCVYIDTYIMTDWTDLVTKVYEKNKSRKGYFYKHALKDAQKLYTKGKAVRDEAATNTVKYLGKVARRSLRKLKQKSYRRKTAGKKRQ